MCRVVRLMRHAEPDKERLAHRGPGSVLNFGQQQRGALFLTGWHKPGRCSARRRLAIGGGFNRQRIMTRATIRNVDRVKLVCGAIDAAVRTGPNHEIERLRFKIHYGRAEDAP